MVAAIHQFTTKSILLLGLGVFLIELLVLLAGVFSSCVQYV